MKAWTFTSRGSPFEVLKFRHDIPQPQPGDLKHGEVLIKVSHVSLFAPEAQLMCILPHPTNNPWIPGLEFSGTVVALSDHIHSKRVRLQKGDAVFGMIDPKSFLKYNGPLADYVVAPLSQVVGKPSNITFEEVAGLSGGGATAVGYFEIAGFLEVDTTGDEPRVKSLAQGKSILITGGSTGTGLIMIQLARHLVGNEGRIVTTASPRNIETLQRLGADEVIDYHEHPELHKYLTQKFASKPFDMIVDITGSDALLHSESPKYLKESGQFAFAGKMTLTHGTTDSSLLGMILSIFAIAGMVLYWSFLSVQPIFLGGVPRRTFFHSGQPTERNLELVRILVEERVLKGVVDSTWEMEDALKAYDHLFNSRTGGKVTVKVS